MSMHEPQAIYYEPAALEYELGRRLKERFCGLHWIAIENHNNIPALREQSNREFPKLKRILVVAVRKTHKYTPNRKVSDFLVPYTSSGCSAICLYCYLVCHYNKCSYLRLFVNREQMLSKLIRTAEKADRDLTFEIGSNSDLILENTITGNLEWTVERFGRCSKGFLTLPTKFDMVDPLLSLQHRGRTIVRMSVNPPEVIRRAEWGTSPLSDRVRALNRLYEAGYPVGLLIAPVVFSSGWREQYEALLEQLADSLHPGLKRGLIVEIIFMTYSYIHRMINAEAFPATTPLYDPELMTGRGRGKYWYKQSVREEGEAFFRDRMKVYLPEASILYIV